MNLDVLILQKNSDMDPCLNLVANSDSLVKQYNYTSKHSQLWSKKLDLIINFNF